MKEKRGAVIGPEGKIYEIPQHLSTVEEILEWHRSLFGQTADMTVDHVKLYFPEIDKNVEFFSTTNGMLKTDAAFTTEEIKKIRKKHPWIFAHEEDEKE